MERSKKFPYLLWCRTSAQKHPPRPPWITANAARGVAVKAAMLRRVRAANTAFVLDPKNTCQHILS